MSAEDVSKFEDKVREDPQLIAELQSLRSLDDRALSEKIAEVGRKHGFAISADDVDDYLRRAGKGSRISDETLGGVAGAGTWTITCNAACNTLRCED